jgi:hypothetical protein
MEAALLVKLLNWHDQMDAMELHAAIKNLFSFIVGWDLMTPVVAADMFSDPKMKKKGGKKVLKVISGAAGLVDPAQFERYVLPCTWVKQY